MPIYRSYSPFLDMDRATRGLLLSYLFVYHAFLPVVAILISDGSKELLGVRIIGELLFTFLMAFPIIFYRREYGWLHPLILPVLYYIGKSVTKNPLGLVFPLDFPMVDLVVETTSNAAVLSISTTELAEGRLGAVMVRCIGMATFLAAFMLGPRLKIPKFTVYRPRGIAIISLAAIGALMAISAYFVISYGGVSALLVAMRGGRNTLFNEQGQFLFAAKAASTIAIIWFVYEPRPFRSPLFILGFLAAGLTAIIVTGSRSSLILPILILVLLWWKRSGRPLILPTLLAAVAALIIIGAFGAIRQDHQSQELDLSVLSPARYSEMLSRAVEETAQRSDYDGDLAAYRGANDKGLLWGRTYVGAATFWVPRFIWNDKPQSADAYNMWINFANHPVHSKPREYGVYGIPVRGDMEAYWNFHFLGLIVLFFFKGVFYRGLADSERIYGSVPLFWAIYIYVLLTFDMSSKSFVDVVRNLILIVAFAYAAGILRLGKRQAALPAGARGLPRRLGGRF